MFRIDRHPLGPRVYFLGARLHEWHLGAGILLTLVIGALLGLVHDGLPAGLAAAGGVWLVAKDWRDLTPGRRDTGSWRIGLHRRPHPLRVARHGEPLPLLAALAAGTVGAVNLVSALTPNVHWRNDVLLTVESFETLRVLHAVAVPLSVVLIVVAPYLLRRRRRALHLAIGLLVVLALVNVFKGLDYEEAIITFATAGLLWTGRSAFYVHHEPVTMRSAVWRIPLLLVATVLAAGVAVWIAAPETATLGMVVRETADLFLWSSGPIRFHDDLAHLDVAVASGGLLAILVSAYLLFRPLAAPRDLPDAAVREAATDLVHAHGADTLAYFKLRRDKHYLFAPDGRAFLGYRVEAGVLLVSGDPVGAEDAIPPLLSRLSDFAERRGLRIGVVGASAVMRRLYAGLGLRAFYMGDEAIVDTTAFSLEGRPIRKVRQSVTRLEKAGYTVALVELGGLDPATLRELERVSAAWRGETAERGFSMALDALGGQEHRETLIVLGRDADGRVRGFLHLVPAFGRPAVSLSLMRRDRDTPNGLTEFLVARGIELLRERGIEEVSLNFAAFARLIASPATRLERSFGRLLRIADDWFQIERLYRFNAKFFPRWEPRYFMYEGALGLPRAGLAAMWVEGQLPRMPRRPFAGRALKRRGGASGGSPGSPASAGRSARR